MSKSILISIKPEFVEKILNGEKTIEIRKTKPSCELPCKVYIYCTKGQELWGDGTGETWKGIDENEDMQLVHELNPTLARLNGKVVAEFTLNKVDKIGLADEFCNYGAWLFNEERYLHDKEKERILKKSCLSMQELNDYLGYGDFETQQFANGYAWHIDNLKIYDKPKEWSEFKTYCSLVHNKKNVQCFSILCRFKNKCKDHLKPIIRPPQSWCYVEENRI